MVSTRPKRRYFEKGEKVLCYEPDTTKAKVLYDSKILGTYETRDKHGKKVMQYKVHFQGWSSSWDRKVGADFLLKDTEENRQLQKDLAEKAQLQLGINLYRKDGKKRSRKSVTLNELGAPFDQTSPKGRSSEDNCSSGSTFGNEDYASKDDCETESYCSSVEGFHDEERVLLRISERLRQYLEYDHDMIVKFNKRHILPARVPIIAILENFVKQSALKLAVSTTQTENTRRRSTQQRTDKKEREFDKLVTTVGLLKEVVDGLRIYFDFTVADYLLYKEEKEYALAFLSEEDLKTFTYIASPDIFNPKSDAEPTANSALNDMPTENNDNDEPQKRKLRSYRSDDCDALLENCLSSIASTSSGASTPLHSNIASTSITYLKSLQAMAFSIPTQVKDLLQNILAWRLLPTNAPPAPSMIFGAPHLARLIVKLPEFLNASSMTDEKLKILLQHLDSFTNFLESQKEWFNEDNYVRSTRTSNSNDNQKENETDETLPIKSEETINVNESATSAVVT